MLAIQVKMETNSFRSIESYRYHIHNYSLLAVKSFLSEVQKYPIIYSSKNGMTLKKELVEFAWTRITIALLDTVVPTHQKVGLINMDYWNQSFRQLWKWMVNIYIKEQTEIRAKGLRMVRVSKYQWLDFMSFLDVHLKNNSNPFIVTDIDTSIYSRIRLEVLPAETKIIHLETGNHIILWLRKFSEATSAKNMCISVCLQIQRCFSPPLPPGLEAMFKQDAEIDDSQLINFSNGPCACGVSNEIQPQGKLIQKIRNKKQTPTKVKVVPFESIVDKDYLYIMSLYPKLAELEPSRKSKVKRLMILALVDAL